MHSTIIVTVKAEGDVMGQADSYIRRVRNECNLSHLEDIFDLYDFVPNNDLRILLAAFHTNLNYWFNIINNDIRYQYDEDGKKISTGGYFHANDSRAYLSLIEQITISPLDTHVDLLLKAAVVLFLKIFVKLKSLS